MPNEQYSDEKLQDYCRQIFEENPHLDKVYATHDGNFFAEKRKSDASNYARQTKQELVLIERVALTAITVEPEDPMARDVAALMMALSVTEDKARELIQEHKGNTIAAIQAETPAPATTPKAASTKATRKTSTKKTSTDGTA